MADQSLPLNISIAPFPEGFQGDMDETFQQGVQNMEAFINGNFLTGLILPPGSTLPTTDLGPIAMGNVWYFWDPGTQQYLPQTVTAKAPKNYAKNCIYQIAQNGTAFTPTVGVTALNDMAQCRCSLATSLTVVADLGPVASANNDDCTSAIKYQVGPSLDPTLAATDIYAHEHLFEGSDIAMLQGQMLTASFFVWANQPGTYSAYLASGGRDSSYVVNFTIPTANTWQRVILAGIPAIPTTGTWSYSEGTTGMYLGVTMAVGAQWQSATANLGKWQPALYMGSTVNNNFMTVVGNQMKITGVKLEGGPTASYLTVPSFEADFHDAVRYFWTSYQVLPTAGPYGLVLNAYTAGAAAGSMLFPRRMAKTPTITLYSPVTNTAGTLRNLTTSVDVTAFAAPVVYQKGLNFIGAITTPASVKSDIIVAMVKADARIS
jgi:hypothetical protein